MTKTKYNGWTNYATWRVNLEIFDGQDWVDVHSGDLNDTYSVSNSLKEYVEQHIEDTTEDGLARSYALAFINDVNWYEIAEHLTEDYQIEETQ